MRSSLTLTTRYFSRAFSLSLSPFKKTKSPTEIAAEGTLVRPCALDFALGVWFCWREKMLTENDLTFNYG